MPYFYIQYSLWLLLLLLLTTTTTTTATTTSVIGTTDSTADQQEQLLPVRRKSPAQQQKDTSDSTCRFYLAESSIPNAGFGIYTVDDIPAKVPLTKEADAPSIVVTDSQLHNSDKDKDIVIIWNHADYFWDGSGSGEFEAYSVEESVVTFGSLCNYHTFLKNVKPFSSHYNDVVVGVSGSGSSSSSSSSSSSGGCCSNTSTSSMDNECSDDGGSNDDGGSSSDDDRCGGGSSPGMGAYSYYNGYVFHSTRNIQGAEEIFCDYGEEWLDGRDFGQDVVREQEYMTAAKIVLEIRKGLVEEVLPLQQQGQQQLQPQQQTQQQAQHQQQPQQLDRVLVSIQNIVKHFHGRIHKILPDSLAALQSLDDALDLQAIATRLALNTVQKRTVEWIQSHGQCLDNLVPQISTLPHAGRGAFAQRFIAKGQVIVPAPLLQIMDNESLNIHEFALDEQGRPYLVMKENDPTTETRQNRIPMGQQLLVNYCMSHEETSMYLCPQTNAILLNHCSTRKSYGGDCERYNLAMDPSARGANAELRWATDWDPDTRQWLNFTMDEMKKQVMNGKRGLSLDIVATRDIHPGDEVFLDYGKGWEEDWEEHVETFVPPNNRHGKYYIPIKELNDHVEKNIRTLDELQNHPYPENAHLACIYWPTEEEIMDEDSAIIIDEKGNGIDWHTDGSIYHDEHPDYETYGLLWKCHLVEKIGKEDGSVQYTVEIYSTDGMTVWAANKKQRILTNYPLKSMQFVPSKYSSDQHLLGTFRSYIRIPDALLPEQWKDI